MVQAAKNYHAMLAARALGRLAGVLPGALATPACLPAQEALGKLLTPALASRLTEPDPRELLSLLNSSVLTPQVSAPLPFFLHQCLVTYLPGWLSLSLHAHLYQICWQKRDGNVAVSHFLFRAPNCCLQSVCRPHVSLMVI